MIPAPKKLYEVGATISRLINEDETFLLLESKSYKDRIFIDRHAKNRTYKGEADVVQSQDIPGVLESIFDDHRKILSPGAKVEVTVWIEVEIDEEAQDVETG